MFQLARNHETRWHLFMRVKLIKEQRRRLREVIHLKTWQLKNLYKKLRCNRDNQWMAEFNSKVLVSIVRPTCNWERKRKWTRRRKERITLIKLRSLEGSFMLKRNSMKMSYTKDFMRSLRTFRKKLSWNEDREVELRVTIDYCWIK